MCSVRIVADSGCDLPPGLVAQYDITIVPCLVHFGQETVNDLDLVGDDFWRRAKQSPHAPATAAPPPSVFHDAFRRLVEGGHSVVCLTLPSKQSATFNSAWIAAEEFGQRVRVVDSRSISLGIGVQVLAAARAALAGQSLDAVQRAAEDVRDRTSVIFVLDTLEWVRRGGRLDRMMPLIDRVARTFHVKPIVEMIEGELRLLGVTRSHRGALERLEEEVRQRLPVERVAAAYTLGRAAGAELVARLAGILDVSNSEIMLQEAGPIFATHAGPNALGAIVVRAA